MKARYRLRDYGFGVKAEEEALPHTWRNVVQSARKAVQVRVQRGCV